MNEKTRPLASIFKTCTKCKTLIIGPAITLGLSAYHSKCFTCAKCGKNLMRVGFQRKDAQILCEACYGNQFLARCSRCDLPIRDNVCVETCDRKKFHSQCFACYKCGTVLSPEYYYIVDRKLYCKTDYFEARLDDEVKRTRFS